MVTRFLLLALFQVGRRSIVNFERCRPCESALKSLENDNAFEQSMQELGFASSTRLSIHEKLKNVGLSDSSELITLAADFRERPEVFSSLLQTDFGLDALTSHRCRAVIMHLITESDSEKPIELKNEAIVSIAQPVRNGVSKQTVTSNDKDERSVVSNDKGDEFDTKRPLYKAVVVNEKAKKRRKTTSTLQEKHDYGLPRNYRKVYPTLGAELDDFETFMTRPSTASQEPPIRPATANVYMRHAKLFLGWFLFQYSRNSQSAFDRIDNTTVSIFDIVPNKDKESADAFLEFILWLRTSRSISASYEANVLRGLTKLLKFRFASGASGKMVFSLR